MSTNEAVTVSELERLDLEEESENASIAAMGVKAMLGGPIAPFLHRNIDQARCASQKESIQTHPSKLSHLEEGLIEIVDVLEESPNDFLAGTVAGMAGVIAGSPADIVKVRMQTSANASAMQVVRQLSSTEGFLGFYRGLLSPLLSVGLQNAIVFGVYGTSLKLMQSVRNRDLMEKAPLSQVIGAGALSGLANCIVVSPSELVKIQLQVDEGRGHRYKNLLHCCRSLYRNGGLREFSRGFCPTLLREIPSGGIYFGAYEFFKRRWGDSHSSILMAGGLGGVIAWVLIFPLDVVKSNIQSYPLVPRDDRTVGSRLYPTMSECTLDLYKRQGMSVFFRGIGICAVRGFFVNGIIFFTQEATLRFLREQR